MASDDRTACVILLPDKCIYWRPAWKGLRDGCSINKLIVTQSHSACFNDTLRKLHIIDNGNSGKEIQARGFKMKS